MSKKKNTEDKETLAGQLEKMQNTLKSARQLIFQQNEMLEDLTTMPLLYATVVKVCKNEKATTPEMLSKEGAKVRIRKDSQWFGQNGGVGVVLGVNGPNTVSVTFSGDRFDAYTYQFHDLELAKQSGDSVTIAVDGKIMDVIYPKNFNIEPGDLVTITKDSLQITEVHKGYHGSSIVHLRKKINEELSEIEQDVGSRVVFNGKFGGSLEVGDRVVLDKTDTVICQNLGKKDNTFEIKESTGVSWDDIGGLKEAIEAMKEAVEMPHTDPAIYKFYNKNPTKGVLLYGKPGCGKTMLGKATATSLAKIYKAEGNTSGMIYIKGPQILSKYVGVAENTIREIFETARKHKKEYGFPAVIFLDEADSLLRTRGTSISSDVENTIVPMFLAEMDGLDDSAALVILSTNRPDALDPAIIRDGRIDRKIHIGRPGKEGVLDILKLSLRNIPLYNGFKHEDIAKAASEKIFAEELALYEIETRSGERYKFTLGDIVSGGMAVNIIDYATSLAIKRNKANKTRKKAELGLKMEDVLLAVEAIKKENQGLNHKEELQDFVEDYKDDVVAIHPLY